MFTKKHDPLVDSVRSVMEKNTLRRQVEEAINEELGVSSRKAIPHEHLASYDAMLEEAYKCAMEEDKDLSPKQKALAKLGTVTGHGGNSKKIDEPDLDAARKGHAHKVGLEEKLTKSMSAGDVISDFVHSENPKFKGKSKKERMKMALGAYYSKHPEKSKKMDESLESIMEEIRSNLEEKLVSVYESGDAQMFEEFVSSLTEEQIEILGLNENLGASVFGGLGDQAAASLANRSARAPARPAPTMTRPAARPSAPATAARPSGAPAPAPAPATGRPAPAPAARSTPPNTGISSTPARPAPGTPPTMSQIRAQQDAASPEGKTQAIADKAQARATEIGGFPGASGADTSSQISQSERIRSGVESPPNGVKSREQQDQDVIDKATRAAFGESTHIKESLESMIRSRYLKG